MWRFYRMTLEMPEIDSKGKNARIRVIFDPYWPCIACGPHVTFFFKMKAS